MLFLHHGKMPLKEITPEISAATPSEVREIMARLSWTNFAPAWRPSAAACAGSVCPTLATPPATAPPTMQKPRYNVAKRSTKRMNAVRRRLKSNMVLMVNYFSQTRARKASAAARASASFLLFPFPVARTWPHHDTSD